MIPWVVVLGVLAVAGLAVSRRYALGSLWMLVVLIIGVVRVVRHPPGWRLAPLVRFPALVSSKCVTEEKGGRSRSWYSATLASQAHSAQEFAVDRNLYEALRLESGGMAFARGDKLHEFLPIEL